VGLKYPTCLVRSLRQKSIKQDSWKPENQGVGERAESKGGQGETLNPWEKKKGKKKPVEEDEAGA